MSPDGVPPVPDPGPRRLTLVPPLKAPRVERVMHAFLTRNRDELLARSEVIVHQRTKQLPTGIKRAEELDNILDRLLAAMNGGHVADEPIDITRAPSPHSTLWTSLDGDHGAQQRFDFTPGDVVHGYSDVYQAIKDVAFEKGLPLGREEVRALDECLGSAIADAVTEFNLLHEDTLTREHHEETRERVGCLVHELRNAIGTASLAASAMDIGGMAMNSPMGAVLKRSLAAMNTLVQQSLEQVRTQASSQTPTFSLAAFIDDARNASQLEASARGCRLTVPAVDPLLMLRAHRELLQAALANLLQNAFKFTHPNSEVILRAYSLGNHILIQVEDRCGGLTAGKAGKLFMPFHQRSDDRSGLGLGLSIARKSIERDLGTLGVRDLPGTGCVFEISLPRFWPQ